MTANDQLFVDYPTLYHAARPPLNLWLTSLTTVIRGGAS
jgi:hypothetical protein